MAGYMEQIGSLRLALGEAPESPEEIEREAGDESPVQESPFTDDPVRVYLREMGSVSLLTRQGEVNLARRMERGKLRVRKVLSRSPVVQQMVAALHEDLRHSELEPARSKLADLIEIDAADETDAERKRVEALQRFGKVAKLYRQLASHERVRLRIKLSQAIREIPFSPARWTD